MTLSVFSSTAAGLVAMWPYLVSGGIVLGGWLTWLTLAAWRKPGKQHTTNLETRLTILVAVIIAGVCAQGMGKVFYDKLHFPIELVIVVGGVLELTAFTCALRARRNIRDPKVGKAGIDGVAVWVVAALSGAFSAMDADTTEVAIFRLVMPLLAAWLWERGMSIERRRVRGGSTIHLRLTPERVLVWLRIAEPSGRTASEVDAHRRLTRVAKAASKVRALRRDEAWEWRIELAQHRLDRAMRSAVAHAGLAADPARQRALIAQLGSMYNAGALADLTPDAPWAGFATPVRRTWFEAQGLTFEPVRVTFDRSHQTTPDMAPAAPDAVVPNQPAAPSQTTPAPMVQDHSQTTPGTTPETTTDSLVRTMDQRVVGTIPDAVDQPMGSTRDESTAGASVETTRKNPPRSSPGGKGRPKRRTREQLRAEVAAAVAEHFENGGGEIHVKPLAESLRANRKTVRELLDEMNVRPIRKAANQ